MTDDERSALEWLLGRMTDRNMLGDAGGHGMVDAASLIAARAAVHRLLLTPVLDESVLRGLRLLSASGVVSEHPDLVAARSWIVSLRP